MSNRNTFDKEEYLVFILTTRKSEYLASNFHTTIIDVKMSSTKLIIENHSKFFLYR